MAPRIGWQVIAGKWRRVSAPAGEHMPENLLDESSEVIVIELKS